MSKNLPNLHIDSAPFALSFLPQKVSKGTTKEG